MPFLVPYPRLLISDICGLLKSYLTEEQIKDVYRAYFFSAEGHKNQVRKSGEAYIFHPLAVTYILAQMRMDTQTLCAALLHDIIEDTEFTKEELAKKFSPEIAELVDGVSKLSFIHFETREQAQAASFRKMVLAMSKDIRVIIIKLVDRLHNMHTIKAMKLNSQKRIARETLEIYAPIANRLGINAIKVELQTLSFATLYPLRYKVLARYAENIYKKRIEIYKNILETISQSLKSAGITAKIRRRKLNYYSIYEQMQKKKQGSSIDKQKTFKQITNSCVIRVIVNNIDDCYRTFGILHTLTLYKPIYEKFRDYIAIPKINGYQSLHTALFSIHGFLIHIQIRTFAMHEIANKGITANRTVKNNDICPHEATNYIVRQRTNEWLHGLLEIPQISSDSLEFFDQFKTELYSEELYVFTPQGKILQLPKGATGIDFAYAVHSDIGNQCLSIKIDGQYAPLSTPLSNGQTMEAFTAEWAHPNASWLHFAVSAKARGHIRHFLKNLQHEEAILLGKRLLDKELSVYALSTDKLTEEQHNCLIKTFKVDDFTTLLKEIGLGNKVALMIARQCHSNSKIKPLPFIEINKSEPLIIRGTEGVLINFARCCHPIPGDEIIGFVSAGKGIIVHTATCRHIIEYRSQPENLINLEWELNINSEFLVNISLHIHDQLGVLAKVSTIFAKMNINIQHVYNESSHEDFENILKFSISVKNNEHLTKIIKHLEQLDNVKHIERC